MPFTAPQLASVVMVANSAELAMPKRTSLPSILPPGCSRRCSWSVPVSSGFPWDSAQYAVVTPAKEKHGHRRKDGPAMPLRSGHSSQRVGQTRRNREDREHLQKIGERCRVFERMCAVSVEKSAAIGSEHLDGFLRGHRALRDGLFCHGLHDRFAIGADDEFAVCNFLHLLRLDQFRRVIRPEVLDYALRHQDNRADNAKGQQYPQRRPRQCRPRNCRSYLSRAPRCHG